MCQRNLNRESPLWPDCRRAHRPASLCAALSARSIVSAWNLCCLSSRSIMSGGEEKPAEKAPAFVFGQGFSLGSGSGFAAFAASGGAAGAAPKAPEHDAGEGEDHGEGEENAEEECKAEFKPVVQLQEVETKTGEEDEELMLELKCKLYRFDLDSNEWKERGVGPVKLLRHRESGKTRLLMRQEKTFKIRANHIVMPKTELQEHAGSSKAWVYRTMDFAEGELKPEMFCVRFGSEEKAAEFKTAFEKAAEANGELLGGGAAGADGEAGAAESEKEAGKDADELASKLESAAVAGEDGK